MIRIEYQQISASGWSNTECNKEGTHGHDGFGVTAISLVV
jgi:hypothetical protein